MVRIAVPATTANLGIGFDCLGLALSIYNYFDVSIADKWEFEGFDAKYCNEENLFIVAYKLALKKMNISSQYCKVGIYADIPVCRGLGSSASLIVGGIYAANVLNGNPLTKMEMLELASLLEGHPDNAAPAIFGGLCICGKNNDEIVLLHKDVHPDWKFGVWIPDFELSTEMARGVLPARYERKDVVNNISAALLALEALQSGKEEYIHQIMVDKVHEPYRKKLIEGFDEVSSYALSQNALAFIISGSGSTCLSIQKQDIQISNYKNWQYQNVQPCTIGAHVCQKDS